MSGANHGKLPAVFMRGGTSKALMFHERDLPEDKAQWTNLFLQAMGSPDPYGRQLDGMGGGVTSVSKVCVMGPSSRADADVDYTFFQVMPREARIATHGNCGNMSSAVGPFVVDEGLLPAKGDRAVVRIHNTNTGKIIRSTFPLDPISGHAAVRGDLIIPGINGSGAPVQLDFLDPGGARTGRLLPTSNASDLFDVPAIGLVEMSLVDAANPVVFVEAEKLGLTGLESPTSLEADNVMMQRLHAIGAFAGTHLNIVEDNAAGKNSLPLIAIIAPPRNSISLDGEEIAADECDLVVRMLSSGQPHRALPVTGAICTAVAMQIAGTIPNRLARSGQGIRRLAMPSGVIQVDAHVVDGAAGPSATSGTIFRTARRLFEGFVYY